MKEFEHAFVREGDGADYRLQCFFCGYPWAHPIHGREHGLDREPKSFALPDDEPPSAESVRYCYGAFMDVLDEYNSMVPKEDRVMLSFPLQEVIASYLAEWDAIDSIKEIS